MNIGDIEKANPSSLKKGIETKRATNPLMPNYKFPGHTEINKWCFHHTFLSNHVYYEHFFMMFLV